MHNPSTTKNNFKENGLGIFIYKHYSKNALYPILIIEIFLLILYFGINNFNMHKTQESLRNEVQTTVPHLARQQANKINFDFEQIANNTQYFADAHRDLLNNIDIYNIPGEQPKFEKAPNGTLYQTNLTDETSLWFPRANITAEERKKITKTASLNHLYKHLVDDIPNVVASYFNTCDNMNRLYPFIPKSYEQYPTNLKMSDYNFYYLADQKHNPTKKPVWTGVYLDPAGQGWMLSCVAPVYHADSLAGVVGLDVTTQKIVDNIINLDLPWKSSAFLTDSSGMIMAMSPQIEELFNLKELKSHVYSSAISKEQLKPEEFNIFKSRDKELANKFKTIFNIQDRVQEIKVGEENIFLVQKEIPETGWRLFVVVPSTELYKSTDEVTKISKHIGYLAIFLMILFYLIFFFMLRKRANNLAKNISHPITAVSEAVVQIGINDENLKLPLCGIAEIDELTKTFNDMTIELKERNKQLIEKRVQIEMQKKEAQLAYAQGMFESASGYMHNIGNSITALNSSIMDLKEVINSTIQYKAVFAKLREELDLTLLDKFEDVLINKTTHKLNDATEKIATISDNIKQTILHQQQSFNDSKSLLIPVKFDISEMLSQICDDLDPKNDTCVIEKNISPNIVITNHKNQLYQGLTNIIKNGIEAFEEKGVLKVSLVTEANMLIIKITDNGIGISAENISKILTPGFTTKKNGHGLGLHSFSVFLSAHKDSITIHSEGIGKGSSFEITLKL